ncbi:putative eukaryotic translation initiation factor 3 subunit L-like [Capsicum annuum]|uniref:Transmembrane protein n=1 Tax=Capsicum annuum TaxID=4072 RepID=A0A1U8E3U4_CAPAN|nr:uncharacterized protein LOC107839127 isoform X1 [Capsicum annuum]KAF3684279.1 putative eukaryotic translation initiation factor 3 subunit L-like [Capsicum annuum]KAF3685659.1 putative eukaryotic translation initiation factor 3 subunit L-like [Capsicum annuum]PHT74420.1 hypothetical protein T459_21697 [Capsicum annuum]
MAIIGDALRQAFMPKHEYECLREEDKAWNRLQRPFVICTLTLISLAIVVSTIISLKIVFPLDPARRPFCNDYRIQPLSINFTNIASTGGAGATAAAGSGTAGDSDGFPGTFYLTNQETVDYYWMVVFVPSAFIFVASAVYLIAGILVAYGAPMRHRCLNVVENNYCASRRGGVRCLSILNVAFAIVFGLLALFLGSTLLTLGSSCSAPLFWCYEIASWGLVILYGGTAVFLRRKAAVILDETEFNGRNLGVEMLEANPMEVTPDVERRVNESFKAWMGPSFLSSDEEDESDNYQEAPSLSRANSSRQRQ